jgi:release factor glutamine methyltransferase
MVVDSAVRRLAGAGCVYAAEEAALLAEAAGTTEQLHAMVARRVAGEPLEYIVGWTTFRGLRLAVDHGVFVPRPRTGHLVDEAASLARCVSGPGRRVVVVDLCCGVGAVGVALATEVPQVALHAVDVDPRAVACAGRNLAGVGGVVHQGDLFTALPRRLRRRVDVLVASPPYVPSAEIRLLPAEAREFEPGTALDGGDDGLALVRRIARGARQWLSPQGCLALEVGESQIGSAADLLEDLGYATRPVVSPTYGSAVVTGRCPH